jgi:hypothetical protein
MNTSKVYWTGYMTDPISQPGLFDGPTTALDLAELTQAGVETEVAE